MSKKASHDVLLDHRDSNPEYKNQNLMCYHYTMIQVATCTRDVTHVLCIPKAESFIVLMRTNDKTHKG